MHRTLIFLAVLLLGSRCTCLASSNSSIGLKTLPLRSDNAVRFSPLSIEAGLSQTRVEQIIEDDHGFIWFGTQYGLNRFDGYSYRVFAHASNDPNSLGGVYIRALFKEADGSLWIACDQTLDNYDPVKERFTHYHLRNTGSLGLPEPTVAQISQDSNGTIWLATSVGLYGITKGDHRVHSYVHRDSDPSSISSNDVQSSGLDRQKEFWVATRNGLNKFNVTTGRVETYIPLPVTYASAAFHEDRQGRFWVTYGSRNYLGLLDRASGKLTQIEPEPRSTSSPTARTIFSMMEDHEGTMWFATAGNGLLRLDNDVTHFTRYESVSGDSKTLPSNRVNTVFEDSSHRFWVGLHQDAPETFVLGNTSFRSFSRQVVSNSNLVSSLVSAIYKDRRGDIWIGTTGALQLVDHKTGFYRRIHRFDGTDVLAIIEDASGTLWFGTADFGLMSLDRHGKWRQYRRRPGDGSTLISDTVERLLIDHSGSLWAATWDGLSRFNARGHTFESYTPSIALGNTNYYAIAEDSSGSLLLGSNRGFDLFDPLAKEFRTLTHESRDATSLSDNRVNAIYIDRSDRVWVGTQNGLNRLMKDRKSFEHFDQRDGLSGNVVSCIQDDGRGSLWMSTNRGLSQLDSVSGKFSIYSEFDGLHGADFTGWGACSKAKDGELFFGGFSGAVAFQPSLVYEDYSRPTVRITEFQIRGKPIAPTANSFLEKAIDYTSLLRLQHSQSIFSITFAGMNHRDTSKLRYRYKLDGLDRSWNEVSDLERTASYTTLPAATYTFRVETATIRGPWIEPGTSLTIIVAPAWWNGWLFRTMMVFLFIMALYWAYRRRIQAQEEQFRIKFEERLDERTRLARTLHDTLLQTIQGSKMVADNALHTSDPIRMRKAIERISEWLAQATSEGRLAVASLRNSPHQTGTLGLSIDKLLQTVISGSDVEGVFTQSGECRSMPSDIREDIYFIAHEAIRNAFTHSHGTRIEVTLLLSESVVLKVRDNGVGISNAFVKGGRSGHFGLRGMKERAARMRGTLTITSATAGGSEVVLTIPGTAED
jgi:ligand-binding sensor domain-containing protein/signal transduction histidine kinase